MQGKLFGNQTGGLSFNYVLVGLFVGLLAAGGTINIGSAVEGSISGSVAGDSGAQVGGTDDGHGGSEPGGGGLETATSLGQATGGFDAEVFVASAGLGAYGEAPDYEGGGINWGNVIKGAVILGVGVAIIATAPFSLSGLALVAVAVGATVAVATAIEVGECVFGDEACTEAFDPALGVYDSVAGLGILAYNYTTDGEFRDALHTQIREDPWDTAAGIVQPFIDCISEGDSRSCTSGVTDLAMLRIPSTIGRVGGARILNHVGRAPRFANGLENGFVRTAWRARRGIDEAGTTSVAALAENGLHSAGGLPVSANAEQLGGDALGHVDELGNFGDFNGDIPDLADAPPALQRVINPEVADAWSSAGYNLSDAELLALSRWDVTPDTVLYRWTEPGLLTGPDETFGIYGRTQIEDAYGEGVFRSGDLDDSSLNVSVDRGTVYAAPDRVEIALRADDVILAGGRFYPDNFANIGGAYIVTTPQPVPYTVVRRADANGNLEVVAEVPVRVEVPRADSFEVLDEVTIPRSDGSTSTGSIRSIHDDGTISVTWTEGDNTLIKRIDAEELAAAQTPHGTPDVRVASPDATEALIDQAVAFTDPRDIPGGSGGAIRRGVEGQYILSADIRPDQLPYELGLRDSIPAQSIDLPESLDVAPRADVAQIHEVLFASGSHSGSAGVVRLAELADGTPVAVKTYHLSGNRPDAEVLDVILQEARSAQLVSDLGIGPRFHGITMDAEGNIGVVMDIVPGDFRGPVTRQTLDDIDQVVTRVHEAGGNTNGDFQFFVTPEGRIQVIDPGLLAATLGRESASTPNLNGHRIGLLRDADPAVVNEYLNDLAVTEPENAALIRERLGALRGS